MRYLYAAIQLVRVVPIKAYTKIKMTIKRYSSYRYMSLLFKQGVGENRGEIELNMREGRRGCG